jgi:hypothetical protein
VKPFSGSVLAFNSTRNTAYRPGRFSAFIRLKTQNFTKFVCIKHFLNEEFKSEDFTSRFSYFSSRWFFKHTSLIFKIFQTLLKRIA